MTREEEVKFVNERYEEAQEGKAEFMERAKDCHLLYRQYQPPLKKDDPPNTPNHVSPKPYSSVELAVAKQRRALIPGNPNDPILRVLPRGPEDVRGAQVQELLLDYHLRLAKLRSKISMWLRQYNEYGVSPIRIYWRTTTRSIKEQKMNPIILPLGGVTIGVKQVQQFREDRVIYDAPDFEVLSIDDWFPDPSASQFDDVGQSWSIARYYLHKREAMRYKDVFDVDLINKEIKDDDIPPPRFGDEIQDQDIREIGNRFDQPRALQGLIEILEFYDGERIISIANQKHSIRLDSESPFNHGRIPIVCPARTKEAGSPWGTGQIEPIKPTVEHITSLRNMRSKNVNLSINKMWKVMKDAGIDPRQLVSKAGGRIDVTDMDDVETIEFPDVTQNAYQEEIVLNEDIDLITGFSGLAVGSAPPSVRSGIQTFPLLDIANERTVMDIETFVDEGLIPLAQQFQFLAYQFAPDELYARVLGPEGAQFIEVDKEDLEREYDYIVEASVRTVPKAVEAEQQLAFLNSIAAVLQGFPDFSLKIFRSAAQKNGLKELVAELNAVINQVEAERQNQGGIISGGAGNQELAGAFGAAGGTGGNTVAPSDDTTAEDTLAALLEGAQ